MLFERAWWLDRPIEIRGATRQRLAAARRAIAAAQERDGFLPGVAALETPEDRVARFDGDAVAGRQRRRDDRAAEWRRGRARLFQLPPAQRREAIATWNARVGPRLQASIGVPGDPVRFLEFMRENYPDRKELERRAAVKARQINFERSRHLWFEHVGCGTLLEGYGVWVCSECDRRFHRGELRAAIEAGALAMHLSPRFRDQVATVQEQLL